MKTSECGRLNERLSPFGQQWGRLHNSRRLEFFILLFKSKGKKSPLGEFLVSYKIYQSDSDFSVSLF